jgi:hypothetical protein
VRFPSKEIPVIFIAGATEQAKDEQPIVTDLSNNPGWHGACFWGYSSAVGIDGRADPLAARQ